MNQHLALIPNLLTGYRFAVIPFLLFCLQPGASTPIKFTGFLLFVSAAITDYYDGYLARRWDVHTDFGKLMDPLADKVLVALAFILLIPLELVAAEISFLILAREFIITGLRGVAATEGIVIAASKLGKWKTTFQLIALSILMFPPGLLPLPFLPQLGTATLYVALILTLVSGGDYLLKFLKIYGKTHPEKGDRAKS